MPWVNSFIAIGLLGACVWLWPYAQNFPGAASEFPQLTLVIIGILSALLIVRAVLPVSRLASFIDGPPRLADMVRPLTVFAALALALYAMRHVGFYPALAGFGLVLMPILGVRKPVIFILTYAGLLLFVFVLFQLVLNVPLTDSRLWGG